MAPQIGPDLDAENDPARLRAEVRRLRSALSLLYTGATGRAPDSSVTADDVLRAVVAKEGRLEAELRRRHVEGLALGRLVSVVGTALGQLARLGPGELWAADLRSAWEAARRGRS